MALELTTRDTKLRERDPQFDALVLEYFPGLFRTMLTMGQFLTGDGIADIYLPLIPYKPITYTVFFCTVILVVSVTLMNLVTAVLVEGSLEQASEDKECMTAYRIE